VAQLSVPVWQALAGTHASPCWQSTHVPEPLHTRFVPQECPAATAFPGSQVRVPLAQLDRPSTQLPSAGVHVSLAVQGMQAPPLHTRFVPQDDPLDRVAVVAVQTGCPVPQLSVPTRHGLSVGVQSLPDWQARHEPDGEQMPVGHAVPGSWFPICTQLGGADEQSIANRPH